MPGPRAVILARRKPGTTMAQMREHQETKHTPLVRSLLGDLFPRHTRRYTPRDESTSEAQVIQGPASSVWWDVMVELEFRDDEHLRAVQAIMGDADKMAAIIADEELFAERESHIMYLVPADDCITTEAGAGQ